jgi:hypothetical protein
MRTWKFLSCVGACPAGVLLGSVALWLASEFAFPLRIEVELESEGARSASLQQFPTPKSPQPPQRLEAGRLTTLSFPLQDDLVGAGLNLGAEPGHVQIHGIRIERWKRWRSWEGDALADWKTNGSVKNASLGSHGLALELSGEAPALISNPSLSEPVAAAAHGKRVRAMILGALLGCALGLRPALRAWSSGTKNQRRLVVFYAGLSAVVIGLMPVARAHLRREKRSGYADPTGDYDFSLLDHAGRRVSTMVGKLGMQLDPFMFYRNYPSQSNASFWVDEHGFRGGIPDGEAPIAFMVGGSTAFGYGLARDDDTISARLNFHLDDYKFVNAGSSGYVSGQELALVVNHLDSWKPALYIALDGWNDLCEAVYWPQFGPADLEPPPLGVNGQYFWLEQRLFEHTVRAADRPLPPWPFPPPSFEADLERRLELGIDRYVTNVERMASWARARQAGFLVILQPEKNAKRRQTGSELTSKSMSPEISAMYRRFVERAVARFESLGIPHASFLDRPELVDSSEELFMDPCHFTPRGCDLVAQMILGEMETARLFQQ